MKWNKKLSYLLLLALTAVTLAACDNSTKQHKAPNAPLRVGVTTSADSALTDQVALVAQQKYGLEIEFINFSSFLLPNEALNSKELDANAFQHAPFLAQQIKDHGYQLVIIGKTFIYPLTAYSKKIHSVDEIQANDIIAIPDDPSNLGRALLLLQQAGLITLRADADTPTQLDITANPLKLQIIEIEAPQLPIALNDPKVTVAIINAVFASQAGLNPMQDGLIIEDKNSPYVNIIAARLDNQQDKRLQWLVDSYHDASVIQKADELFKGNALPGW